MTHCTKYKKNGEEENMNSQMLREARGYEEIYAKQIPEEARPAFHLSTRVGWMNDPNGFCYYQGKYHLFYQYYPYDSHWGPMHWGHAVSSDLLHWEYLPAALAPDELYDRDGVYSGGAGVLPDGRHLLIYTGRVLQSRADGGIDEIQKQCLAVGDGVDYVKYENNPVIDGSDLPEGSSRTHFRDPKLWQEADGTWRCVMGNLAADGTGQIVQYESKEGFRWNFKSVIAKNNGRFGVMWECPDFFELDGKHVLLTSPQDMLPDGFEYHNGNGTLCLIGTYDDKTGELTEEHNQAIDYGIDFYATQTVLTPDGRRVMIAWMQNWDTCNLHTRVQPWFGQMTLPRELSVKNGRLYQQPVRELLELRRNPVSCQDVLVKDGTVTLDGIRGRRIDLELELSAADPADIYKKFALHFAQNEKCYTAVSFRPYEEIVKIDRKFSGSRRAIIHQRRCLICDARAKADGTPGAKQGHLKLRLILDRFSAEVFLNDGEQVMTMTLYTDHDADGISFVADGAVRMNVTKYDLQ